MVSEEPIVSPANADWYCIRPSRLKVAALKTACRAAEALQFACGSRLGDGFVILMYHRVADEVPGVEPPTMNVTPERLRRQLSGLLALGYECWPLEKLVTARRANEVVPSNVFAITFDDGFENNYLNALPVLQELQLPATIFVATKYLDSDRPFPFDDWSAVLTGKVPSSGWRPLSSRQCEELVAGGLISIGAHTHSHEKFLGRPNDFRRDMRQCLDILRERFGVERPSFAFPYGYLSPELVEVARQVGVSCAVTTRARRVLPHESEFAWGRIWADAHDSPTMLAGKMSWYPKIADFGQQFAAAMASRKPTVTTSNGDLATAREASRLL